MRYLALVLKAVIPQKYHHYLEKIYLRLLRPLLYIGIQYSCPCCGWHFRRFLPGGVELRLNALCPRCDSLERHRLLYMYLKNRTNLFSDNLKVLHFAPEYCLQRILRLMPNLDYVSADLDSPLAMAKMDIMNILFEDNSFDVILCSHVLEHIIDDHKAMKELFRVVKPGGWAILQTPIDLKLDKTFEDPGIVSPEERERFFGQSDHVRIYGRDYIDRLKKAGFDVTVVSYLEDLGPSIIKKHVLSENVDIYFCTNPKTKKINENHKF